MNNIEMKEHISEALEFSRNNPGQIEGRFDLEVIECDVEKGSVRFMYRPADSERNIYGGVHGGMLATVFDFGMSLPIEALVGNFVGTIQLSVQYLIPVMGKEILFECEALHTGNRVCQCHGVMYDANSGKAVATAHASYSKVNITRDQLK